MRLCLDSGLAAGVGTGVVEAEVCLVRGSGLGVRAVSARSRAARAKASGDDGSEDRKQTLQFPVCTELSSSEGSVTTTDSSEPPVPVQTLEPSIKQ